MSEGHLKIALFSDSALPVLNGVSISIDALIKELRYLGHSVHLFTAAYRGHKDSDPNVHRMWAAETPWTKGYPIAFPPFYPMVFQFRRVKFDIIHTHTPWNIGFVGLRWGQSHEIPVVSTYHTFYDKYTHYIPFLPKRYVRYKIAKHTHFYYSSVQHVITPSEAARAALLRHSVRTPITVVPTGIPRVTLLNREEVRHRLGIHKGERILLYVGRIAQEKNMKLLFEAFAIARSQDPSLRFWLVGDGPFRKQCATYARQLGVGDSIKFVGFVPRDQVNTYYNAADLFIFSSMTETQGLVVSEAMSYGLPAIVVQGGGVGAAVVDGKNGYLVRNNANIFAACISKVLEDQELYQRLSQGAAQSAQRYTTLEMARNIVHIYRESMERFTFERQSA
jgi:glycosyltransferase involved in cell wall biosynthesis